MPRRRSGTLIPLEIAILERACSIGEFHGFAMAKSLQDNSGARTLTGHGTLYKALGRLESAGLLTSAWEDHAVAEHEGRPRRRLYEITSAGRAALARAGSEQPSSSWRPGVEPA